MGFQVVNGAQMSCTFGSAPGSLVVLPTHMTMAGGQPAANIMDFTPFLNITGFVMCKSMANPAVASATAAASGVLTPMPCTPVTAPWIPGVPTCLVDKMPALDDTCTCICAFGGTISISSAGQTTVQV